MLRWVHPHEVAALEQREVLLLGRQDREIGGERGRVGQDLAGLRVAEHLPALQLLVELHRPGRPEALQPSDEVVERRLDGRHVRSLPRAEAPGTVADPSVLPDGHGAAGRRTARRS